MLPQQVSQSGVFGQQLAQDIDVGIDLLVSHSQGFVVESASLIPQLGPKTKQHLSQTKR